MNGARRGNKQRLAIGKHLACEVDPALSSEIRITRPAVIISATAFNQRSKVTVLPITSATPNSKMPSVMIAVSSSEINGLDAESYVVCINLVTFDKQRLLKRLGQLEREKIQQVQQITTSYLDLEPLE